MHLDATPRLFAGKNLKHFNFYVYFNNFSFLIKYNLKMTTKKKRILIELIILL